VSREHRRAKTDRLDTELLMRVFLGWLRGEKRHCSMVAIPTIEEEDTRRPNRERQNLVIEQTRIINQIKAIFTRFGIRTLRPTMRKLAEGLEDLRTAEGTPLPQNTLSELRRHIGRLRFVREQIRAVEQERLRKLAVAPPAENKRPDAMVRLIARVLGVGIETADMLVNEIFSRHWRDRKAVARYAGLTGSPDESGSRRRERGLARAGNVRVRSGSSWLGVLSGSKRTAPWPNGSRREPPTAAPAHARR
jgi:transposase